MPTRQETLCCPVCHLLQHAELQAGMVAECARCSAVLHERKVGSVVPTAAFALAALILYVPANIYPILRMERYGLYSENTVWSGIVALTSYGYWFVAAVVFVASMVVPLVKLLGLLVLVALVRLGSLATVIPGPGLWAFAAVVVLTMLATAAFDPSLLWRGKDYELSLRRRPLEGAA